MRSKILIGSVCALAFAATSAMAAREFNGSIWFPDTHPLTKAYLDWVKRLDAASKGELKAKASFEVFYATKGAVAAVEKAGGTVKVLRPAKAEATEKAEK